MPLTKGIIKLSLNDKVLCDSRGMFYEAKVVQVATNENGEPRYLVHYQGWHKRHDEWIDEADIPYKMKMLEEGAEETTMAKNKKWSKKEQDKTMESAPRASITGENVGGNKAPSTTVEITKKSIGRKRKAPVEPVVDPFPKKSDLRLQFPQEIKNILIDDCDFVTRQDMICRLPAEFTVSQIINEFFKEVDENTQTLPSSGLQSYFDALLPAQLLYKNETPQYSALIAEKTREVVGKSDRKKRGRPAHRPKVPTVVAAEFLPRNIYGYPHLLRFLSKFEDMLKTAKLDDRIRSDVMKDVNELVKWMNQKRDVYYKASDDYIVPSRAYMREVHIGL